LSCGGNSRDGESGNAGDLQRAAGGKALNEFRAEQHSCARYRERDEVIRAGDEVRNGLRVEGVTGVRGGGGDAERENGGGCECNAEALRGGVLLVPDLLRV
jgi:hypothetical protein